MSPQPSPDGNCLSEKPAADRQERLRTRTEVVGPLTAAARKVRGAPVRVKTVALLVPLVLLEAGLAVYAAVLATSSDLALSVAIRLDPVARALFMGPFSAVEGGSRALQDYYFLALVFAVLVTAWYRFGSVRKAFQIGSLAVLPLPVSVYLFDPLEFGTFFVSAEYRLGLGWFSNELLLYACLLVFAAATGYPVLARLAGRRGRSPGGRRGEER